MSLLRFSCAALALAVTAAGAQIPSSTLVSAASGTPTTTTSAKPGKKPKAEKPVEWPVSPDKTFSADLQDAMFLIDGLPVRRHITQSLHDPYLYFFLPGTGTVMVSLVKIPDATLQKGAMHGNDMTVTAAGHTFQLSSSTSAFGKGNLYVRVDAADETGGIRPRFGSGSMKAAPYRWSDTRPSTQTAAVQAPAVLAVAASAQ